MFIISVLVLHYQWNVKEFSAFLNIGILKKKRWCAIAQYCNYLAT